MTNSEKLLSSFSENYFYKELVYADLKFTPIGGTEIELADLIINLEDIILAIQLKERNEKDRTQDKNIEEKWLKKKCKKAKEQIKDTISYITSEKVSFINARGKKTIINPNAEVVPLVVFENDSISEYEHLLRNHTNDGLAVNCMSIYDFKLMCKQLLSPIEIIEYLKWREVFYKNNGPINLLITETNNGFVLSKPQKNENLVQQYLYEKYGENAIYEDRLYYELFEVPWKVRMAEIMRIICFAITKEQQNAIEVATALNNAFLCPSQEELYVSALMRKGYFTDSAYTVVNMCVLEDNDRVTGTRLEQILSKLSSHIRCNYNGILCCAQEKQILLVLCDYSDEACRKTTERIFQILCRMVCQKEQIFVSVSKQISGIRQIYKSYQFAEKMSDLLCVCQVPGEQSTDGGKIIFYKDLGIYRVLLTLTDKEAIKEYLADTVAPLYEYDEMNHSDLVRVLQCYLANDCSVKSASQELIVHRNTINYKLGKAAEILGKNLSDFDVRFQLRLGFLLYQMNEM